MLFLLLLLHGYLAWRLLPDLPAAWMAGLLGGWLLVSCLVIPLGLLHWRVASPRWSRAWAWLGFAALGLFASLLSLTLLRDLFASLWQAALVLGLPLSSPWPWRAGSAWGVPVGALLLAGWGVYQARRTPAVREVGIAIAGLPSALQGLRIVQLSDVHVGPTIRRGFVQRLVAQVNALEADLVAITGDLVDGSVGELRTHVQPLAALRSRHGTFFVTGNHEYYVGVQPWLTELRRLGVRVLLNEHEVLQIQRHGHAGRLVLAGVNDWSAHHFEPTHRSDPHAALRGAPQQADLKVLLAHQPRSAGAAAQAGFDVQLSGHTHGGQIWPWSYLVYLQQPYRAGLRRQGRLWVYTSRGSGYWGPPMRLGAPSEVSLITLLAVK